MSCICQNPQATQVVLNGITYCKTVDTLPPSCTPKSCPPDYVLVNGECVRNFVTGQLCPEGYNYIYDQEHPSNSKCVFYEDSLAACTCTADVIAEAQTICSEESTSIALSSTVPGVVFSWLAEAHGVTGASNGGGTNTITQTLQTTGTEPGTVNYTITPYEPGVNGCAGESITITVTVNPKPNIIVTPVSPQTISNNTALNIGISSGLPGTTFSWTVTSPVTITGATAGSGNTITNTLVATQSGSVTYHIVATSQNGCTTTMDYVVNVTSIPNCPSRRVVFQICNANAAKDDNFDILLNGTYIGDVNLNANAQVGSIFIADLNPSITVSGADFACPISNMVVYRFDPSLLQTNNVISMVNTQVNNNGNYGTVGVRNYLLTGNDLSSPCVIANLTYSGGNGASFTLPFNYTSCCEGDLPA